MSITLSLLGIAALYAGWHINAFPIAVFLAGAAGIALADVVFLFPFHLWQADQKTIFDLQEKLRPKIRVVHLHQYSEGTEQSSRTLHLEIENQSSGELSNCLAKVTALKLFRDIEGVGKIEDMTDLCSRELPLPLITKGNLERKGNGPFHLRAGEAKKIMVCSRGNGKYQPLWIHYEAAAPFYMRQVPSFHAGFLDITIFGSPSPTSVRINLDLNESGQLVATTSPITQ
jgi:hypothetical protein